MCVLNRIDDTLPAARLHTYDDDARSQVFLRTALKLAVREQRCLCLLGVTLGSTCMHRRPRYGQHSYETCAR
jgi:hypothetical protein